MEESLSLLEKEILQLTSRYTASIVLVAIAGVPGSGKSTFARDLVDRLNMCASHSSQDPPFAVFVPMDGFHLRKSQLDEFDDPEEAHRRRGAPWTFDIDSFKQALEVLLQEGFHTFPSFDHSVGDPCDNDISVELGTKIVVIEGNYLLLDEEIWRSLRPIFHLACFLDCDIDLVMNRVRRRHLRTGLSLRQAIERIESNDRVNANLIIQKLIPPDYFIKSIEHEQLDGKYD